MHVSINTENSALVNKIKGTKIEVTLNKYNFSGLQDDVDMNNVLYASYT